MKYIKALFKLVRNQEYLSLKELIIVIFAFYFGYHLVIHDQDKSLFNNISSKQGHKHDLCER